MTGRRWLITALLVTVTPPAAAAQQGDSLLVEVSLAGAGSTLLVVERDSAAGTVRVPTAPLYELAGLGEPPVAAATLDELRELLGIELLWLPRQLRIVMRDPWQLLPATRARVDRLRAEAAARAATTLEQRRHGAFGGVTVDDRREALLEFGYSMGRLYGRGAYSTVSGAAWSAGANPVSGLWLTYLQSERRPEAVVGVGRIRARRAHRRGSGVAGPGGRVRVVARPGRGHVARPCGRPGGAFAGPLRDPGQLRSRRSIAGIDPCGPVSRRPFVKPVSAEEDVMCFLRMAPAAAFLVVAPFAAAAAQSGADDAAVSIEVLAGSLNVTRTQDLVFGQHSTGATVRSSDVGTSAQWTVDITAFGEYSYVFTLPGTLDGPGGSVPVSFGPQSAIVADPTGMGPLFDPNTPFSLVAPVTGTWIVDLGSDLLNDGLGDVTVNLSGAAAGTYTGVVTLTVAAL